ncbi:hypothetical protein SD80_012395 [Scytonema tolypothrichoides VB-61278]|nr:hypothetical protein SD80_012395 [Scytonema tolypothrichoides VB-61278]
MTTSITQENLCPALDAIINQLALIRQSPDWKRLVEHRLSHPELTTNLANCLTYAKQLYADLEASLEIIDEVESVPADVAEGVSLWCTSKKTGRMAFLINNNMISYSRNIPIV